MARTAWAPRAAIRSPEIPTASVAGASGRPVQATQLIHALAADDPFALREAYAEAYGRGETWRKLLDEAVSLLPETARVALDA